MANTSDLEVVEAVPQGDTERYGELVDRYQLAAWKLAYSFVGNMEEAKDLAQNSFVKAYRNLRGFRRRSSFGTWLYRIVANECKDFFRRRSRNPETVPLFSSNSDDPEAIPFDPPDPSPDPRQAAEGQDLAGKMAQAIGRLPTKQRAAFLLHHVNGLPLQEVAQVMDCRLGTVKAHLFRATETLRFSMETYLP